MATQPERQFLLCLVMGRDAIELWRFTKSGPHKRTGKYSFEWVSHNPGWQVSN